VEALCLEQHLKYLPRWRGIARHYSKSARWFEVLAKGHLQLESFMGCCKPSYTFAYALDYAAVLIFTELRSARLVGALTLENCEGEVILPRGATFKVISADRASREVVLAEVYGSGS
jgi:hypothetical protein